MTTESQASSAKARGAFFTPAPIAEFLAAWAIHSREDTVLEPSCGEAAFIIASAIEKAKLDGDLDGALVGVEIHERSAELARHKVSEAGSAAEIIVGDFFESELGEFDVVLGNPPFIRYQSFSGEERARALAAALRQGVRLNKLSSAWAAFLIHACSFLKPDGRLGFVLPAELLSVNYAATVRSYLMNRFESLKIVTFENNVFPGVQEEIVLLLASGRGSTDRFELLQARSLDELAGSIGKRWSYYKPQRYGEKWTNAFISENVLEMYRSFEAKNLVQRLGQWGHAYLGCVTGSNEFFLLSKSEAATYQLSARDLVAVLPPGSSHLKGTEFSAAAWEHMRDEERKTFLFCPASFKPSKRPLDYISIGERQGVQRRYKCRVRNPWWSVPTVDKPDLFVTYMTHEGVRLITNSAGVHITNSHYGFELSPNRKSVGTKLLPIASLNSLTLLGSEIEGRSYGGGLLKIEPKEVERLPLPSVSTIIDAAPELEAVLPQVATSLRREKLDVVCQPVDEILLRNGLGLSRNEIRELRSARRVLFERRLARAKRST